jgi:hypothetical protein
MTIDEIIKRDFFGVPDFTDGTFDAPAGRVHEWRNHVPHEIKTIWATLSDRERKLVAIMAERQASAEEWD